MMQKFIISRFHKEAGLLFFTVNFILILVLTDLPGLGKNTCSIVYANKAQTESDDDVPADAQSPSDDAPLAESESVVVVIAPGHGGKNLGAEYEDITEKELTLTVAKAMKAELEQYEGITVYLTRTEDTGLSLEERCEYAADLGADFLFCLHFNMSEYHTLFGAETWVSAFGDMYAKGYGFAEIEMELLEDMGLYSRGIKTRLNDDGKDYYGIIRHATERNLPCVLIEHCHLDQDNDKPFYDRQEKLEAFGRLDAEAVARYYGLRSESLGKDFSDYPRHEIEAPAYVVRPDLTKPDVCLIEEVGKNEKSGEVTLRLSAADYDSGMLYYAYSYDGGMTFSELQKWPDKSVDTFELTLTIPSGIIPQIVINAYNGYDLYTTSNLLNLPSMNAPADTEKADNPDTGSVLEKETTDTVIKSSNASGSIQAHDEEEAETPLSVVDFLKLCLLCAFLVFILVFSVYLALRSYKRKRRRKRRHR